MTTFEQWSEQLDAAFDWSREDDVIKLLKQYPEYVLRASTSQWGRTPLQSMVYAEMEQAVTCWIELGGDVNVQDREGGTALHAAAEQGTVRLTSLLLDHGANPNAIADGRTPLANAAERRDFRGVEIADLLLQHGATLDLTDAVWLDRVEDVRRIVSDSPNAIQRCREPNRLVHNALAMDVDGPTILHLLLEHGADPNSTDEELGPALVDAVKCGSLEAIQLLLRHGANPAVRDKDGKTLLELANSHKRDPQIIALVAETEQRG